MKDRDFLYWIHCRLVHVHSENPMYGYMHRLRAIIRAIPANQDTPCLGEPTFDEKPLDSGNAGE